VTSPTQRTLAECRRRGWTACVVEKWVEQTRRRVDAFGFGDVLVAAAGGPMLIQATSGANGASRVAKITGECAEAARAWLASGGQIEVWAWRKYAKPVDRKYWRAFTTPITLADFGDQES
jgi:hypothetical protein